MTTPALPLSGQYRISDAPERPYLSRLREALTPRDITHPVLLSALEEGDCTCDLGVYRYEASCRLSDAIIEGVRGYLFALGAGETSKGYLEIANAHMRFVFTSLPSGRCSVILEDYDSAQQPPSSQIDEPFHFDQREAVAA